jgi:Tfp pilus assembly protein PilZ
MKKLILSIALVASVCVAGAQQVSLRAKAMLLMSYARPEYMIKDVKIYTDTMTVYSLAENVVYPFGKWESIEKYITETQLLWTRDIGYKQYFDSMEVGVNTLRRLDGSYINMYYGIHTSLVEMLDGKITDSAVVLANGIRVGMKKEDVFQVFFKKFPKSYVSDIHVLKVISGANEVGEVYTFKGKNLRHIGVISKYKYY